jgi:hypothetical protein
MHSSSSNMDTNTIHLYVRTATICIEWVTWSPSSRAGASTDVGIGACICTHTHPISCLLVRVTNLIGTTHQSSPQARRSIPGPRMIGISTRCWAPTCHSTARTCPTPVCAWLPSLHPSIHSPPVPCPVHTYSITRTNAPHGIVYHRSLGLRGEYHDPIVQNVRPCALVQLHLLVRAFVVLAGKAIHPFHLIFPTRQQSDNKINRRAPHLF